MAEIRKSLSPGEQSRAEQSRIATAMAHCTVHHRAAARSVYRDLHRQLESFPVQHVRDVYKPYFRQLLRPVVAHRGTEGSETASTSRAPRLLSELQVKNALQRAKRELNHLRAANAGYRHAFERTMEIAFGRRGWVRWQLLNSIYRTSGEPEPSLSPSTPVRQHFPPVLRPLLPKAPAPQPRTTLKSKLRADTPVVKIKQGKADFAYMLKGINVPLTLPGDGPKTGWEGKGVEEALRALAMPSGLPRDRRPLPPKATRGPDWDLATYLRGEDGAVSTSSPVIKAIQPQPEYPFPPARSTRQNPKTWTKPHTLSARFIRRSARRILESLPPALSLVDGEWVAEKQQSKRKKGKKKSRKQPEVK